MILVDTLVTQNVTIKSASQIAGYSKGESGRVSASRALRTPKVQRYLIFRVASELGISSVQAVHRLKSLMNSKSDYVSLEATKDVLDRVGLRAPDKIKHSIDGDIKIDINLD
jgi:phage terminase small subunit